MKKFLLLYLGIVMMYAMNCNAQNVGIGTSNPRSKLEVNGSVRIDTVKTSLKSRKIVVIDSTTNEIAYIPIDSFKTNLSSLPTVYYVENDSVAVESTSSLNPQTRITITVPAGNYIIEAYCEVYNDAYVPGVLVILTDGLNIIGSSVPYGYTAMYGHWSTRKKVNLTSVTTYYLKWSCAQNGSGNSYIRNSRICLTKIL